MSNNCECPYCHRNVWGNKTVVTFDSESAQDAFDEADSAVEDIHDEISARNNDGEDWDEINLGLEDELRYARQVRMEKAQGGTKRVGCRCSNCGFIRFPGESALVCEGDIHSPSGEANERQRPRDTQGARVYRWEDTETFLEVLAEVYLPLWEIKQLVKRVCGDYCRTVPHVSNGRRCKSARTCGNLVTIPWASRNLMVVLHELAHVLCPPNVEAHGPEYMRIYIDLLLRYGEGSGYGLVESARRAGIKVASKKVIRPVGRDQQRLASIEKTNKRRNK